MIFRHDLKYLQKEFDKAILEFIETEKYQQLKKKWGLENE